MDKIIKAGLATVKERNGNRIPLTEHSKKNFNYNVKSLVADKLSQVFFVTYLDKQTWKGAIYNYALLKPTTEMTNQWGISQQVLCLIKISGGDRSGIQRFNELNDLDYIDRLHSIYKNRLDKLCTLIITDDDDCKSTIKRLSRSQSEHKVLLPIKISDINVGNPKGVIEDTLVEFFQGRDLYNYSSPLKTENYFFGRDDIVSELNDAKINFQNYGLFGLRKIGKTSILYTYMNRLTSGQNFSESFVKDVVEEIVVDENGQEVTYSVSDFIDKEANKSFAHLLECEGPSIYENRWYELLEHIVEELILNLEKSFAGEIKSNNIDLNQDLIHDYTPRKAQISFERNLFKIKEKLNLKYLTLIFDEIEFLTFDFATAEHWKNGEDYLKFWGAMRAVQQKNHDLFNIVVCGVNPWMVEKGSVNNIQNPFFAGIKTKYVPFFTDKETIEMITGIGRYMGLSFSDEACYNLLQEFGGHPHMLRLACSELHVSQLEKEKFRPASIQNSYIKSNLDSLVSSCNQHLTNVMDIFQNRYPNEYEMLKLISANEQDKLNKLRRENPIDFNHLEKYNLIKIENDFVDLKINAIKRFFNNSSLLDSVIVDSKDRLDKLNEKITSMEQVMRAYVRDKLIEKDPLSCHNKVLKSVSTISRPRKESMNEHYVIKIDDKVDAIQSTKNLLNPGNSPLMLNELSQIINRNWIYFQDDFEKRSEFVSSLITSKNGYLMYFNQVLSFRNQAAHANTEAVVEDSVYRQVLQTINLFTEIFEDI